MMTIETINPEKILKRSNADAFWILLVTGTEHLGWTGNEFRKIEIDGAVNLLDLQSYCRGALVKAYNDAVRLARGSMSGILKVVEVPM